MSLKEYAGCHTCLDPHKKGNVRKIDVQGNSLHRGKCLKQGHRGFLFIQWPLSLY